MWAGRMGLDDDLACPVGEFVIDGFMRVGLFRADAFIDGVPSLRMLVEHLVKDFDTWLHAI